MTAEESLNNFTPRAHQVLDLARKEAARLNHNFLCTEHVLLGLFKLGQGTAINILRKRGLDLEILRQEVEKQVGTGPDQEMVGNIPFTPRVKKVIALAKKEAKQLYHTYVGTEHLLLGLLREGDGVAAKVLASLGVELEETRHEILRELDPNFTADAAGSQTARETGEPTTTWEMSPKLNHTYIGTEHLLLGLLQAGDEAAATIMKILGVDLQQMRNEILRELDPNFDRTRKEGSAPETKSELWKEWWSRFPKPDPVDLSRRYDVYCIHHGEAVVYRNVLLKAIKGLFASHGADGSSLYIELEQPDGKAIFLPKHSIFKFCDPGATASGERVA